jgi:hypothetical protein
MTGSKQVAHWTSETWYECSEIAGSPQGSPQQLTLLVVKLEGGPVMSVKPRQKSCVRSSLLFTLLACSLVKHSLKSSEAAGFSHCRREA